MSCATGDDVIPAASCAPAPEGGGGPRSAAATAEDVTAADEDDVIFTSSCFAAPSLVAEMPEVSGGDDVTPDDVMAGDVIHVDVVLGDASSECSCK